MKTKRSFRINILGLGDVGSNMLIGLRLMGGGVVDEIGIYDLDKMKEKRFEAEVNQIYSDSYASMPNVRILSESELFDADIFAFTATREVPAVGSELTDVRKVQFEANSKILSHYVELAARSDFNGIFAVVSDPVDELCQHASKISEGSLDPERIKGFGLGVMYARARYIARSMGLDDSEIEVFGPHGEGLIVANSTVPGKFDEKISDELTKKTTTFNLEVRKWGFKPYIAPAMSSGALSMISMLSGQPHHSTAYIDGRYFGMRNTMSGSIENPKFEALSLENIDEALSEKVRGQVWKTSR